MKNTKSVFAAALLAVATFAAPAFADTTLHVFLWDDMASMDMVDNHKIEDATSRSNDVMGVTVNTTVVPAGKVTFDVMNSSENSEHEMVVSQLSGPDGTLPYNEDDMKVDEEAAGSLGEVAELETGTSGQLTVTLTPGTYVIYCNIEGHYAAGMWTKITVE